MKVLFDTNVVLDVLLHRDPFYDESRAAYNLVEQRKCTGCVSSSAMTDIFYIAYRELKDVDAVYQLIDVLCEDFIIAPVLESTIKTALALRWNDFEDAVQYVTARENEADCIVTRNTADFERSAVHCISPADFLTRFTGSVR